MIVHLPTDLEGSIQATVRNGFFASVDDALAEAARLLLRDLSRKQPIRASANAGEEISDPFLGLMRDDAELMDEILEDAMQRRKR